MHDLLSYLKSNTHLDLVSDSKNVHPKSIFFAIVGTTKITKTTKITRDGHQYLPEVIAKKPQALVVQDSKFNAEDLKSFQGQIFVVENSRRAWAKAWKQKADFVDKDLKLFGVTGTNGKTSITYMIEHILNAQGQSCAVMGTIDHHYLKQVWPTELTTPGAEVLFSRLKEFKNAGAKACALEISSHGLKQNRALDLSLDVAVFSNLTNDHLDYHPDMQDYFSAKEKLFTELLRYSEKKQKVAVINLMDLWGRKIQLSNGFKTYYLYEPEQKTHVIEEIKAWEQKQKSLGFTILPAEVEINNIDAGGCEFTLTVGQNPKIDFYLPIVGRFQVFNWCEAVLACYDFVDVKLLSKTAQKFLEVPGRLQKVKDDKNTRHVFVDYSHTPDALRRSLESLKLLTTGRLVVVFGCGGDRDQSKRPLMAEAAEDLADTVIVTNDNPRTENPQKIADQILAGFKNIKPEVILDRAQAISQGIDFLKSDQDILLIAGKGHEDYQIIGTEKKHFSDYQHAELVLKNKGKS